MQNQLNGIAKTEVKENHSWDSSITTLFNPHIDTLFSYEMPGEIKLEEDEYLAFMDETYRGDIKSLKESFRWSNAYLWLLTVLKENEGCLYFGELSELLHNAMISDPKPYRKDVKIMLANLLKLTETLGMEEVIIDRPNYSQRVSLATIGEDLINK